MMDKKHSLDGIIILFVEDRPSSIKYFTEKVREVGAKVIIRRTIRGATDLIATESVHFVVIDLFLDPPDSGFEKYYNELKLTNTNQGQLLGFYLNDKKIPYLYLSVATSYFVKNEKEKDIPILYKSSQSMAELIAYIIKKLDIPGKIVDGQQNG